MKDFRTTREDYYGLWPENSNRGITEGCQDGTRRVDIENLQGRSYLYSITTRFQVRTPSESSSDICSTDLSDRWMDPPSSSVRRGGTVEFDVDFKDSDWLPSAIAARAPLVGQELVWDKGRKISHAEAG